ncbi:MAG: hypothetical protein ACE15E_05110 [Acidobacteriota bacterium]
MRLRYLLFFVVLAPSVWADGAGDNLDLKAIIQEAAAALKTSSAPEEVAATLKSRTYGKQIAVAGANVTDLRDMDVLPVSAARQFSGLYTLGGRSYPEPSSLSAQRIAETLRGLMSFAIWKPDSERIGCSGAGLVVLTVKQDHMTLTYHLLASTYTARRLRLGQLVSLEVTISGVSMANGPEVFGVLQHVDEP